MLVNCGGDDVGTRVGTAVGAAVGVGGGVKVACGNWVAVAVGEAWVGTAVGGWFSLDAETGLQATMPETAKKANSASKKRSGGEEVIGFIFTGRIVDQFGELTRRRGQPGIESFSSLIYRPTKPYVSASLEIGHGLTRMNTDKNPCKLVPHQHLPCVLSTRPIGDL